MDSAVTSKGQMTIPKAIRDHLGIKPGDRIKFFLHPDGTVALLPRQPITALRGIVPGPAVPVSLQDMEDAIAAGATSG